MAAKDVGRGFIQSPARDVRREVLHLNKQQSTQALAPEQPPERQPATRVTSQPSRPMARSGTGGQAVSTGELTNPEWREVAIANRAWLDSQPTYRYVPTEKRKR